MTARVLALDVGDRRIGMAVSDPLRLFARPVATHARVDAVVDVAAIVALIRREAVGHVVVGLPLLPSGDRGEQAGRVERFMTLLAPALAAEGVAWSWWDESYTTLTAAERRRDRGGQGGGAGLDAEAAAVILEEWLRAGDLAAATEGAARDERS